MRQMFRQRSHPLNHTVEYQPVLNWDICSHIMLVCSTRKTSCSSCRYINLTAEQLSFLMLSVTGCLAASVSLLLLWKRSQASIKNLGRQDKSDYGTINKTTNLTSIWLVQFLLFVFVSGQFFLRGVKWCLGFTEPWKEKTLGPDKPGLTSL